MDKASKNIESKQNTQEWEFFKELKKRLNANDGDMKYRLRTLIKGIILFFVALIFTLHIEKSGISPFLLGLVSSACAFYIPISAGIITGYIFYDVHIGYLFACICIFIVRIVMSYAPMPSASREIIEKQNNKNEDIGRIEGKKSSKFDILSVFFIEKDDRSEGDKARYREKVYLSMIYAAIGGFISGLFLLISDDLSYYGYYSLILLTLISPLFSYLFLGYANKEKGDVKVSHLKYCIAMCGVVSVFIHALGDVRIMGIMLSPMLAVAFSLYVTKKRGIFSGVAVSIIVGLVLSPLYMPLLIICSVIYGFLSYVKTGVGLGFVCGAIILYCYYFGDTEGMVSMLTPMLAGVPLFLAAIKFSEYTSDVKKTESLYDDIYYRNAMIEKDKNNAVQSRLYGLSSAFSSLSKVFYELSDIYHRPDALRLRDISDECFNSVCESCQNKEVCHGVDYSLILEANLHMTSALHKKGRVDKEDLSIEFLKKCSRHERLISDANILCSKYTEKIIKGQRGDIFAKNYEDVNAVLLDALKTDDKEYECDIEAGESIYSYLMSLNFNVRCVLVCGRRSRRVRVKGLNMNSMTNGERAEKIRLKVSEILKEDMSGPVFEVGNDGTDMLFYSRPKLKVICSHARRAAFEEIVNVNEEVNAFSESKKERRVEECGDSVCAFLGKNSYFYSMICDGMGSGEDAAFSSGLSASFATKMLSAGNRADITLRMMNNLLRSENYEREKECSVAVDLLELDLMNGCAFFIKSGAAPTYILREDKVYKVSSKTLPLGIMKTIDVKINRFDVKEGDVIIMLSDGCTHDEENSRWLIDLLMSKRKEMQNAKYGVDMEKAADSLRDLILDTSRKTLPNEKRADDTSVSVVCVSK